MATNTSGIETFFNGIREKVELNVAQAADQLTLDLKELISIQSPPPSSPGEPLHRESGDLQESIRATDPAWQGDIVFSSVGTDIWYGLYWELHPAAARPWLGPGLRQNQAKLAEIILDI